MFISCKQNPRENKDTKSGNKSVKIVARFKYFGTTLKHKNCIHESTENVMNSGNACYCLVRNFVSNNIKIKIYRIRFCAVFCLGKELSVSR